MTKRGRARWLLAGTAAALTGLSGHAQAQLYWDTNGNTAGAAGDGTPNTAPGTWDAATANWSTSADGDIATIPWTPGEVATFSAGTHVTSSSTITVSGTQSIGGLNFQEGNVILNTGTLDLAAASTFNADSGAQATINSPISGAFRWTKTGPGTIAVRAASNANTGGVTITGGTVVIGNGNVDTQLGPAPGAAVSDFLILDGGTLRTDNSSATNMNVNRGVRIDSNGGTFNIAGGGTWTVNGIVSGTGRLTKTGPNILVLNNASNTYSGGTTFDSGIVSVLTDSTTVGAAARLGTVPASADADNLLFDGGTLRSTNGSAWTLHANRGITVNAGGATFENTAAGTITVNGTVTGTGTITKQIGSGVNTNLLVFAADNSSTFSGKFVVTSGAIQSNNAANSGEAGFGAAPGSFVADGITLDGGGRLRVGPNNYTIHANRGITLGAGGGVLDTANSASMITIDSVVSGAGSLTKTSIAGTPQTNSVGVLRADNTYTGDTIVSVGTLRLDNGGSIANGNINVAAGATFTGTAGGSIEEVIFNVAGDLADLATISGTLDISALGVVLNATGTQTAAEYVLVDKPANSANVVGLAFASETLPAGWSIDYDGTIANPNAIVAVVPEPAAMSLLALGGLLLARRRS